jgi:hypothetical protein
MRFPRTFLWCIAAVSIALMGEKPREFNAILVSLLEKHHLIE